MSCSASSCSSADSNNKAKWDAFYIRAATDNAMPPPWKSPEPFQGLVEYIEQDFHTPLTIRCIEFGCGCSASLSYLSSLGAKCTGVDISKHAIERAQRLLPNSDLIKWVQADMVRDDIFEVEGIEKEGFDFVFDMQCFHVVRSIDESKAVDVLYSVLRPGGRAMVVVGAVPEAGEPVFVNGPPTLTQEELLLPFQRQGFELMSIYGSRFNNTPRYMAELPHPPRCWIALFRKPVD